MKIEKYIALIILTLFVGYEVKAQEEEKGKKVWASGASRSVFQQNNLVLDSDTTTPKKLMSGHTLVDLAINAKPNDQTFLHAMVRIRNDFGGFWGSGVTFDIRQLYVKGLISNSIRYQLGDMNYKLTPFTFYSNNEELSDHQSAGLSIFRDMVRYDMFYTEDNTWRQQGAAVDFALEFDKGVEELEVNVFTSRNRASDFAQQNDRVFFGGNMTLKQSKLLSLGINYIDLMDLAGTSKSKNEFHNPVVTGTTKWNYGLKKVDLELNTESGVSQMYELNSTKNKLTDFFFDMGLTGKHKKTGTSISIGYTNVGPQFRSVGAQSKRLNFEGLNLMYSRYQNGQMPRGISQLDISQDASLYQMKLDPGLQAFSPAYDNVTPYGKATPNRQGFNLELNRKSKNEFYEISLGGKMLSEIVGQGGDDLRKFSTLDGDVTLNFENVMVNRKKPLELSIGYTSSNTKRTTSFTQANVDLKSSMLDFGVKIGLTSNFELLGNYRSITAQGDELLSLRNLNTEVIDFESYSTDLVESMVLLGLRYNFSKTNRLDIVWQKMNWEDKKSGNKDYGINQFAIAYNLKF
jgi:hypothetical protein